MSDGTPRQRKKPASPAVQKAKDDARKAMEARLAKRVAKIKGEPAPAADAAPAADDAPLYKKDPAKNMPRWLQYAGIVAFVAARIAYSYYSLTGGAARGEPLARVAPDGFEPAVAADLAACAAGLAGKAVAFTAAGAADVHSSEVYGCLAPMLDVLGDVRSLDANAFVARVETAWTTSPTAWTRARSGVGALPPVFVSLWYAGVPDDAAASLEVAGSAEGADPPDVATPCAADDGFNAAGEFDAVEAPAEGPCYVALDALSLAESPPDKRVRVRPRENALVVLRGDAARRASAHATTVVVLEQYRLPALLLAKAAAFEELH